MQKRPLPKIQHLFLIKVLERLGIQGTYLTIIKSVCNKHIANIRINEEKLKAISLKSGTRQGCPFSSYIFYSVLETSARTIRPLKIIKRIHIVKKYLCLHMV